MMIEEKENKIEEANDGSSKEEATADAGSTNQELKECEKKRDEYLAGWQRARADFLNYKKEETDKISGLAFFAQAEVILNILETLDTFNKAKQETGRMLEKHPCPDLKGMREGFLQVGKQFQDVLKKYDIEEIETIGEKFDPEFAEAIEEIESDSDTGIIVEEIQKGYKIVGKVLRPAKVKVAK
jgi:molecular chaperone GrpE